MSAVALPARFARLVKVEHTIFALPFAYIGALLSVHGVPSAHDLLWISVAMVGARSVAMALNRLIDAELADWVITVNPFDVEGQAEAIHRALELDEDERRRRLDAICAHVRDHDVTAWIERQLAALDGVGAAAR